MRRVTSSLIFAWACFTAASTFAQQPSQPFLVGIWEGTMTVIQDAPEGSPAVPPFQGEQFPFRLDIRNTNLVMYFRRQEGWAGIGEGADLRLNQEGRSAIVVAQLPAGDLTETWMLNIARWDEENIAVHLSRITSADKSGSPPPASFTAFGQMKRIPRDG